MGQRLSYPAASAGAIAVLALAVLGLLVVAAGVRGLVRELRAEWRFRRVVAICEPGRIRGAWIVEGARPQAFCAGLVRPRVFLSLGALELLDARELNAVLAHERHHASRRDPLRLAYGRVLADALFFLPFVRVMVERQRALAEIGADEAAVLEAPGNRSALASAMLSFAESGDTGGSGVAPDRVDFLLGRDARRRLPLLLWVGVAVVLLGSMASAALAAQGAAGSLTLKLPFLSGQPCVVVLASVPVCVTVLAVLHCRRRSHMSA